MQFEPGGFLNVTEIDFSALVSKNKIFQFYFVLNGEFA